MPTKIKLANNINLLAHYAKGTLLLMLQLLLSILSFFIIVHLNNRLSYAP